MKKFFITRLILTSLSGFAQNKKALLVAVGQYPNGGAWRSLSSENDVKYIKAALLKNGFDATKVKTISNENATKQNMLYALDELAADASNGDIILFHFSGHGQQIQDDKPAPLLER